MSKRMLISVLGAVVGAALLAAPGLPTNFSDALANQQGIVAAEKEQARIKSDLDAASNQLFGIVAEYNHSRTFDIYYGDVERISEVFNGIAGVEIKEVYEVDPMNGYIELGPLKDTSRPAAVRYDLYVTDPMIAAKVVNKMELPVVSLSWSKPNKMSVTFLTGGDV